MTEVRPFSIFLCLFFLSSQALGGQVGFGAILKGGKMYSLEQNDVFSSYDDVFWTMGNLRYQLGDGSEMLGQVLVNANVGYIDRAFGTRGLSFGSELDVSLGKKINANRVSNALSRSGSQLLSS